MHTVNAVDLNSDIIGALLWYMSVGGYKEFFISY